jgi:hypothetical protein
VRCIRGFTTKAKNPKGSIGKESTPGANFSFPRHNELFQEGFYNGDGEEGGIDSKDHFQSPFSKKMESENATYKGDSVDFSAENSEYNLNIEGGILQNYRKLNGQTLDDVL